MMSLEKDGAWCLAPYVGCKCWECTKFLAFPYPNPPQVSNIASVLPELKLPSSKWSALLGCADCGHVCRYDACDVRSVIVPTFANSGTVMLGVEFLCGQELCGLRAEIFVDSHDRTEADIQKLVKTVHFHGKLPCGHDVEPLLQGPCGIRRITDRLW
jgi:hypothetical protein